MLHRISACHCTVSVVSQRQVTTNEMLCTPLPPALVAMAAPPLPPPPPPALPPTTRPLLIVGVAGAPAPPPPLRSPKHRTSIHGRSNAYYISVGSITV